MDGEHKGRHVGEHLAGITDRLTTLREDRHRAAMAAAERHAQNGAEWVIENDGIGTGPGR